MTKTQIYLNKLLKELTIIETGFLHKLLSFFLSVGAITLFEEVYLLKKYNNPEHLLPLLRHEKKHVKQQERDGFMFYVLYTFPQNLAILSLFAFLTPLSTWFLVSLISLVALFPWKAPWRYKYELEAYKVEHQLKVKLYGSFVSFEHMENVCKGWTYYKMNKDFSQIDYLKHFR